MSAPSESQRNCATYRTEIEDLYWNHGKELPEVMRTMEAVYGFVATKKMYKKHFKAWGLKKYLDAGESMAMINIEKRRRIANKETEFIRHGKRVEPGKLRRFEKRHKLLADGGAGSLRDAQVATPPNITYRTPEPERSDNFSLPPAPVPYPDSETSEGEQAAAGDSPGSYALDGIGSPSSSNIPWPTPLAMPWPSDDTYSGSQGPAHTFMAANFISDGFSSHQAPERPHDFSQASPDAPYSSNPYLIGGNLPSHGYHPATNGTPSWIFIQQQPQQQQHPVHPLGRGLDGDVSAFSSHYDPNMGHPALGVGTFGSLAPAHAVHIIPDTALDVLDHTPLHNAVVCGNLDQAKVLLDAGANPNCSARGGMTPLHYAAYQRNVDMANLLLGYGANLDAMTDKDRSVLFFALRDQAHIGNKDMLAYASQNVVGAGSHTDEDTVRIVDALFSAPIQWSVLRRSLAKADKDGVTPLMVAAGEGFYKTATMLLKWGAQPEVRDHANHTALKYAARSNYRNLVRLLLLADSAVSLDRDLSHILKLASKNFTDHITAGRVSQRNGGLGVLWDSCHKFASEIIATEMVRLCREMGVLNGLLHLAEERRKTNVLQLLRDAMRQLDMEDTHVANGS